MVRFILVFLLLGLTGYVGAQEIKIEKSTEKIDGAVATIMALDRAIRCGNDTAESVYDNRGLLFI